MSSNSCSAADAGSTFWDFFARQADKRGDAVAVVYPNAADRSYADLRRRAEVLRVEREQRQHQGQAQDVDEDRQEDGEQGRTGHGYLRISGLCL